MWMLYAEQHLTKVIDLNSAIEHLYEKLGALEFDADHEAIYGMERNCFANNAHFTSEQGRFNPDGNWPYSLQSCIENVIRQFPDKMAQM
ncbi:hypothetical protein FQA39_LY15665 [Lamprigera yunnana]|nr:hypothetical protein FQA39_LY15665 [Lamprigera yunnana]